MVEHLLNHPTRRELLNGSANGGFSKLERELFWRLEEVEGRRWKPAILSLIPSLNPSQT